MQRGPRLRGRRSSAFCVTHRSSCPLPPHHLARLAGAARVAPCRDPYRHGPGPRPRRQGAPAAGFSPPRDHGLRAPTARARPAPCWKRCCCSRGYRTGLYIKPHFLDFNERARINGEMAGDEVLVSAFDTVEECARRHRPDLFRVHHAGHLPAAVEPARSTSRSSRWAWAGAWTPST